MVLLGKTIFYFANAVFNRKILWCLDPLSLTIIFTPFHIGNVLKMLAEISRHQS